MKNWSIFFCVVHTCTEFIEAQINLDLLAIYSIRGIHPHRQISTPNTKSPYKSRLTPISKQNRAARCSYPRGKIRNHVLRLNPCHQPHLLFLILLLLRLPHLAKLSAYQNQGLGHFSRICRRIVQSVEKDEESYSSVYVQYLSISDLIWLCGERWSS